MAVADVGPTARPAVANPPSPRSSDFSKAVDAARASRSDADGKPDAQGHDESRSAAGNARTSDFHPVDPTGWVGKVGDLARQGKAKLGAVAAGPAGGVSSQPRVAIAKDFPDPSIVKDGNRYYAFATGGNGHVLQVSSADTPDGPWSTPGKPSGFELPSWAAKPQGAWAPDVHRLANGQYIMYFSARTRGAHEHESIGYATASSPGGPWKVSESQLISTPNLGGAIDPSSFTDRNGKTYIVYKNDGNSEHKADSIWIQEVRANGHTPMGKPIKTLTNHGGKGQVTIEAPQIVRHGNEYVMFYSTGSFNDSTSHKYTEHYAIATSLDGHWTRGKEPLLETGGTISGSNRKLQGPGGATVLGNVIVFHNISQLKTATKPLVREMLVAKLQWRPGPDGTQVPFVEGGIPKHHA